MKKRLPSGFLKRGFQLLLSLSLASSLFLTGSLAYASSVTQQTPPSKCPKIPANFDFVHASKQELHQYLLPAAPPVSDSQAYNNWKNGIETTMRTGGICVNDRKTVPASHNAHPIIFGPARPALVNCPAAAPSGTRCLYNWNGYVAQNGTQGFNEVVGIWNVECVTTSQSPSDSVEGSWVGLGGYSEDNLWQVGSAWAYNYSPYGDYFLWYEAVGHNGNPYAQTIAITNCGDQIYADIWFAPNNPSSNVSFYLTDDGLPYRGYYAPAGFSSGYLTADWIDERPGCSPTQYYRLADYNYSEWTHAYASPDDPNAGFYSIGDLTHTRIWMEDNDGTNNRIAWTDSLGSELGSGNDNYRAHWENNGHSQCG